MRCKQCKGEINPSRGDLVVRISVTEHRLVKSGAQSHVWEEPTDTGTGNLTRLRHTSETSPTRR